MLLLGVRLSWWGNSLWQPAVIICSKTACVMWHSSSLVTRGRVGSFFFFLNNKYKSIIKDLKPAFLNLPCIKLFTNQLGYQQVLLNLPCNTTVDPEPKKSRIWNQLSRILLGPKKSRSQLEAWLCVKVRGMLAMQGNTPLIPCFQVRSKKSRSHLLVRVTCQMELYSDEHHRVRTTSSEPMP